MVTSRGLWDVRPGSRVTVAGVVTHRQRPMTAQGTTFLNLEDETGLINVVVSKGCWSRFRRVAREAPAMTIRGRLERSEGVINVVADHLAAAGRPRLDRPRQPGLPMTALVVSLLEDSSLDRVSLALAGPGFAPTLDLTVHARCGRGPKRSRT